MFFVVALGCVSSQNRGPAGVNPDRFSFQLYGNAVPTGDYKFQLLDLEALKQNKIEFQSHKISDSQSAGVIKDWQESFARTISDLKDGLRIAFKTYTVVVGADDMKNLRGVLKGIDSTERDPVMQLKKKVEVISAFNELFKSPLEENLEVLATPLTILKKLAIPGVRVTEGEPVRVAPSSFWTPRSASDTNMWMGGGTVDFTALPKAECIYRGAKTGYGVHAGFKITCDGKKLKWKFGREDYSGPFNSRLYHRLGFNVPSIHHVKSLKMKYDLRIFSEINSRRQVYVDVKVATKPTAKIPINGKAHDATEFVDTAILKNGEQISGKDLKAKLLKSCTPEKCDYSSENVDTDFEKQIDSLVLKRGTVTEDMGEDVGSWSYSALDHAQRTEIKALFFLGAWTGNFDLRKDNNQLVWVKGTGELKHFVSDPGAGFGNQANPFFGGSPFKNMKWTMTSETSEREGENTTPVVQVNFRTLISHPLFHNISYQEAQWIVRQMAGISEEEISQALAASGLSAAEFLLAREKLISVQQDFIEKFGLRNEFASRLRKINRAISFDPDRDQVSVKLPGGSMMQLEARGIGLKNGELVRGSSN